MAMVAWTACDYRTMRKEGTKQKARLVAGPFAESRGCEGLLALPHLLAAEECHAAGHAQAVGVQHLDLGLVGLALGRVEHGAAGPFVAVGAQAPEDGHALDRLALVGALALVAGRVGSAIGLQDLDDLALQGAVGRLGDLDDRLHLAGLVVDGLPAALRGGVLGRDGERQRGEQQGEQGDSHDILRWSVAAREPGRSRPYNKKGRHSRAAPGYCIQRTIRTCTTPARRACGRSSRTGSRTPGRCRTGWRRRWRPPAAGR